MKKIINYFKKNKKETPVKMDDKKAEIKKDYPRVNTPKQTLSHVINARLSEIDAVNPAAFLSKLYKNVTQDGGGVTSNTLKSGFQNIGYGIKEEQLNFFLSNGFIGWQNCSFLSQNWIINRSCLIPGRDAVRKGYEIKLEDSKDPEKIIKKLKKTDKIYKLNRRLISWIRNGRIFGVGIAIFIVESSDPDYYLKPFNIDGIKKNSYRGVSIVDPNWAVPELDFSGLYDPASIDFYEPEYWVISGRRYHKSHLSIFRHAETTDILKPVYYFGGPSVPQQIAERVYCAERTANEALLLAMTKRSIIYYTDLSTALANENTFLDKMELFNQLQNNFATRIVDNQDDKIEHYDTSLAELDQVIRTQYELVAAAAGIPVTRLMGTSAKGMNATGEGDESNYHETLETIQAEFLTELVERHYQLVIKSKLNTQLIDFEINWLPLDALTEKELAEINFIKSQTDKNLIESGQLSPEETRARLSQDRRSGYHGLPEQLPESENRYEEEIENAFNDLNKNENDN